MNGNIRVGNLFGIPFYLNPSWFFVLALITLSYGQDLALFPQLSGLAPYLLGLVAALLLFASVLAHELGHSFAAKAQGINVKSITLFLFGGLATLEKDSDTPGKAMLVAIAGPAVSFLLFFVFLGVSFYFPLTGPLNAIVSLLATVNLTLGLFNLIPGLPLDGGNILRAIVWKITGNPNKGIIFASRFGQFFGWSAIAVGALGILRILPFGSFWSLLIGWFLLQNAGSSAQGAKIQETLSGLTAQDALIADSPIISSELNLREFVNNYVIGKDKWLRFLVTNSEGQLVGAIFVEDLKKVSTSLWSDTLVKELMQPVDNIKTVKADLSLLEVVMFLQKEPDIKQLTVVDQNQVVLGLVERESIANLLRSRAEAKGAIA